MSNNESIQHISDNMKLYYKHMERAYLYTFVQFCIDHGLDNDGLEEDELENDDPMDSLLTDFDEDRFPYPEYIEQKDDLEAKCNFKFELIKQCHEEDIWKPEDPVNVDDWIARTDRNLNKYFKLMGCKRYLIGEGTGMFAAWVQDTQCDEDQVLAELERANVYPSFYRELQDFTFPMPPNKPNNAATVIQIMRRCMHKDPEFYDLISGVPSMFVHNTSLLRNALSVYLVLQRCVQPTKRYGTFTRVIGKKLMQCMPRTFPLCMLWDLRPT